MTLNVGGYKMRIVFWNCNGGFRNKYQYITQLKADLYIIAEVEPFKKIINPRFTQEVMDKAYLSFPNDKKGLLAFTCGNERILPLSWDNFRMRYFLPFTFNGKKIVGIWAKDNYIEDEYLYAKFHLQEMKNAILIGDFNSNVIWDKHHGYRTHTDFNDLMYSINHISAYHHQNNEPFGKETQPTFFMYHKLDRPYHIDYTYVPKTAEYTISFGDISYSKHSDHLPIILDI